MTRLLWIVLIICASYGTYKWVDANPKSPLVVKATQYYEQAEAEVYKLLGIPHKPHVPSVKPKNTTKGSVVSDTKRYSSNGVLLLTSAELEYLNKQVDKKYYNQDLTNAKLADGTVVPLIFKPNGKICKRTGLPEMTISINNIAVLR